MQATQSRLKMLILTAMFAAITGVLAQLTVPLPYIPITGQTLAVGLTATILGSRYGALSMIVYMAVGAIGAPVFSGASGGLSVLVGKSGGYIFGFIVSAFIIGYLIEKLAYKFSKKTYTYSIAFIANLLGSVVILTLGMIQLKFVLDLSWNAALAGGVYPFIAGGIIKALLSTFIGITVRERLESAKLIPSIKQSSKAA